MANDTTRDGAKRHKLKTGQPGMTYTNIQNDKPKKKKQTEKVNKNVD